MASLVFAHSTAVISNNIHELPNYLGEIFNIGIVDPETFERRYGLDRSAMPTSEVWSQRWTLKYLEHLNEVLEKTPNAIIKARLEDFFYSKVALALIEKFQPRIYNVYSQNELISIKNYLIVCGHYKKAEVINPTLSEFITAHRMCVIYPKAVQSFFRIHHNVAVNESIKTNQGVLGNEAQIDEWFSLVDLK